MAWLFELPTMALYFAVGVVATTALHFPQQPKHSSSLATMTVTPKDILVTPGRKKVSATCQLSNLSPQFHLTRLEIFPYPNSLKSQSGSATCSRKRRTCTIRWTKIYKEHAVWYSCVAHIHPRLTQRSTKDTKPVVLGKQFRMDMKTQGRLQNVRVDIERKGAKTIQYTLPQTSIPTLKIESYESKLYTISCSTDAEEVGDLELQWRFFPLDHQSLFLTGHPTKPKKYPVHGESQEGVQLTMYSVTSSKFKITAPSTKLDGLYYCEWTTRTAVLRSPSFNLHIVENDACKKPEVWKKVCHKRARCVRGRYTIHCKCKLGFDGDGKKECHDINECKVGLSRCPDNSLCVNTFGKYRCECKNGFIYRKESKSCEKDSSSVSASSNNHQSNTNSRHGNTNSRHGNTNSRHGNTNSRHGNTNSRHRFDKNKTSSDSHRNTTNSAGNEQTRTSLGAIIGGVSAGILVAGGLSGAAIFYRIRRQSGTKHRNVVKPAPLLRRRKVKIATRAQEGSNRKQRNDNQERRPLRKPGG